MHKNKLSLLRRGGYLFYWNPPPTYSIFTTLPHTWSWGFMAFILSHLLGSVSMRDILFPCISVHSKIARFCFDKQWVPQILRILKSQQSPYFRIICKKGVMEIDEYTLCSIWEKGRNFYQTESENKIFYGAQKFLKIKETVLDLAV